MAEMACSKINTVLTPKKIFKNIPFLGKLEVKHVEVMAAHRKTCSFYRFCNGMTTDCYGDADCCGHYWARLFVLREPLELSSTAVSQYLDSAN
ncbi:hypothetical protein FD754_000180 [Muntiacus muntjak]|uniref:Uncharacterized protein n=1 Tax=Muntiacus muntjak TaxID=9888 RepID=A0A5N3W3F3_MUNMU|nr:hypothetical protein FD754_000180 [Muntiacus muntjak]